MKNNLFDNIPSSLPNELLETLYQSGEVKIERIVSRGHSSEEGFWYDQDEDEFVVLLSGQATLRFESPDSLIDLKAGDFLTIKKHQKHRVESTSTNPECVWLAVFIGGEK